MIQQVVTLVPSESSGITTYEETLNYIKTLLPSNVIGFLEVADYDGGRLVESIDVVDDAIVITTNWQDSTAQEYKTLMAGVSEGIKTQLRNEGWEITFSPETADL
jgi:hypothetical protein